MRKVGNSNFASSADRRFISEANIMRISICQTGGNGAAQHLHVRASFYRDASLESTEAAKTKRVCARRFLLAAAARAHYLGRTLRTKRGDVRRMWLPYETAVRVADLANIFLVASLAVGVMAALAIWQMANVKEAYWEQERRTAGVRISDNERLTAQAKSDAAGANERAALLEKDAAEARLEQERLRQQLAWRRLTPAQSRTIADGFRHYAGPELVLSQIPDPEAALYANDIEAAMTASGIKFSHTNTLIFARGPVTGIFMSGPTEEAVQAAGAPFNVAGINVTAELRPDDPKVTIVVASKPPPASN